LYSGDYKSIERKRRQWLVFTLKKPQPTTEIHLLVKKNSSTVNIIRANDRKQIFYNLASTTMQKKQRGRLDSVRLRYHKLSNRRIVVKIARLFSLSEQLSNTTGSSVHRSPPPQQNIMSLSLAENDPPIFNYGLVSTSPVTSSRPRPAPCRRGEFVGYFLAVALTTDRSAPSTRTSWYNIGERVSKMKVEFWMTYWWCLYTFHLLYCTNGKSELRQI